MIQERANTYPDQKSNVMLEKEQMERLNFLAKKSKQEPLSLEESKEQKKLRADYILKFKAHFKAHLDSIEFVDEGPMKKK